MIYIATIDDEKLVLTPPVNEHFNKFAKREISLSDFSHKIGAVETSAPFNDDDKCLHISISGDEQASLLFDLPLDDIAAKAPGLVEVPSMTALLPMSVLEDVLVNNIKDASKKFVHEVFNDVAAGKKNEYGYNSRALVNPDAVEAVEDMGQYRKIRLKDDFGPRESIVSPLPAQELKKRLGLKPPAA